MSGQEPVQALPWHADTLESLPGRDALHHGQLIDGLPGIGKREFAVAMARRILCLDPDPGSCSGTCQSCQLFNAGTHPDVHVLCTERETATGRIPLVGEYSNRYQDIAARERRTNPSQVIPVDQVRLLIERLTQSAHISASRVAILIDAGRMNANAANALLKLLEEPPEDSFLLLVTARPETLPATVRSRCLTTTLRSPDTDACEVWLSGSGAGAELTRFVLDALTDAGTGPLDLIDAFGSGEYEVTRRNARTLVDVIARAEDPVAVAAGLAKQDGLALLQWLQVVASDLIRYHTSGGVGRSVSGIDVDRAGAAARLPLRGLYQLYAKIGRYRNMASDQLNLQLALEDVLIGLSGKLDRE